MHIDSRPMSECKIADSLGHDLPCMDDKISIGVHRHAPRIVLPSGQGALAGVPDKTDDKAVDDSGVFQLPKCGCAAGWC